MRPRSVAIVGASADPRRTAGKPLAYLQKHGFGGRVYVVNPRATEIGGLACLPSIADLPEAPDVALVLLGAHAAITAVGELAQCGARTAIVLAGGFAEIDAAGAQKQEALVAAAAGVWREHPLVQSAGAHLQQAASAAANPHPSPSPEGKGVRRMRLLGPNTIGIVNVLDKTALSASGALELDELPRGHVGVVSQSGGMLGALLSRGAAHGVGFSRLISTGNEADVDVCDALDYLLHDDATQVIAIYLESVRRPAHFRELAAQAINLGKRLVVYKVGRSEAGAQSATSHTGALAGTDRMYDALFRQTGAVRVETLDGLIDVSAGLVSGKRMSGAHLGILTSTGGGGSLVADACGVRGFAVPRPDTPTAERLRAALQGEAAMADRNPIDLTLANLRGATYRETIAALVESPTFDGVVVVVGSSGLEDPSLAAAPVREAAAATDKPVVVYVNPHAMNIVRYLNSVGVPAFNTAEGCAAALGAMRAAAAESARGRAPSIAPPARQGPLTHDRSPTDQLMNPVSGGRSQQLAAAGPGSQALNEAEALALFAQHGIRVARHVVATSPEEAAQRVLELGSERVVVKILSSGIAHKSDVGGVRVGVSPGEVAAVCRELQARAGVDLEGFVIQEQVTGGTELLLGMIHDAQLGAAIVLGAGGTATEVFGDSALRLLPLRPEDPQEMLSELRCRVLLEGFRGQPPGDVEALFAAVRAFGALALGSGDRLREAEINPLFVLPQGEGVIAADALVIFEP